VNPNTRIRDLLRDMCAGNYGLAADVITEEFVVIPRSDLPAVKRSEHDSHTYYTDGENVVYTGVENARTWCLRDVAVWQFIELEGSRRQALLKELGSQFDYNELESASPLVLAIDRIIELEKQK
jgi:hypothetical protein